MKIIPTEIPDVKILEPVYHGDNRGWFVESYSKRSLEELGIDTVFVQDNQSMSAVKGILRGLHFQKAPEAQTKLVRCTRGIIRDFVVDLRKGSPTYKKWTAVELSEDNHLQLYIPAGFGHGFVTLSDHVEIQYKVDKYYSRECDRSILWCDKELGIDWGVSEPVLSDKDRLAPTFADSDVDFVYGENC